MRGVEFAWDAERPRALIMGIVNVTPDSFADGGRYLDPAAAVRQARALAAEGADLLDVGAESTRPGSPICRKAQSKRAWWRAPVRLQAPRASR